MPNPHLDQLVHVLTGTIMRVMVLSVLAILFIGLPLYWLRLKLERKLVDALRSRRGARDARKAEKLNRGLRG